MLEKKKYWKKSEILPLPASHHLYHFVCKKKQMRRIIDNLDSKFSDESDELADEGITGPERAYRGPHLAFPLQKKDIDTLIEVFRKKKVTTDNQS